VKEIFFLLRAKIGNIHRVYTVKVRLSGTLGECGVPMDRTVTYDTHFNVGYDEN
jgi:hypothetical protein